MAVPAHSDLFADERLLSRVIPAVMSVIDRGEFHGSVMRKVAKESRTILFIRSF